MLHHLCVSTSNPLSRLEFRGSLNWLAALGQLILAYSKSPATKKGTPSETPNNNSQNRSIVRDTKGRRTWAKCVSHPQGPGATHR
jgi:hypothetical protein